MRTFLAVRSGDLAPPTRTVWPLLTSAIVGVVGAVALLTRRWWTLVSAVTAKVIEVPSADLTVTEVASGGGSPGEGEREVALVAVGDPAVLGPGVAAGRTVRGQLG